MFYSYLTISVKNTTEKKVRRVQTKSRIYSIKHEMQMPVGCKFAGLWLECYQSNIEINISNVIYSQEVSFNF